MSEQRITFTKGDEGQWMLKVPADQWVEGAEAVATRSNGSTTRVRLGDWFEQMDGGAFLMVAFESLDPKPATASRKPRQSSETFTRAQAIAFRNGHYGRSTSRRHACITGGNCSSVGSGRSCGGYDCDAD